MERLVRLLKSKGVLKSEKISEALLKVDRKNFVPENLESFAYQDEALPIGEGQTISQPYTVVFMLELLEPKGGEKIIDVGHGSGWQTAILAEIVGKKGVIYAIERVEKLCRFGKSNVGKYSELFSRVKFFCQDASAGFPEEAKNIGGFNGIIAAAAVTEAPTAWRAQLKIGGRLVYPKSGSIFLEKKIAEDKFQIEEHPGFAFVPFVKDKNCDTIKSVDQMK